MPFGRIRRFWAAIRASSRRNSTDAANLGVDQASVTVTGGDNTNALLAAAAVDTAISTLNDWRAGAEPPETARS